MAFLQSGVAVARVAAKPGRAACSCHPQLGSLPPRFTAKGTDCICTAPEEQCLPHLERSVFELPGASICLPLPSICIRCSKAIDLKRCFPFSRRKEEIWIWKEKKNCFHELAKELGAEMRACDFSMLWWKWRGMKCSKAEKKQPALEEFHQGNGSCVTFPVRVNEVETTHEKTSGWLHSITETGRLSGPSKETSRIPACQALQKALLSPGMLPEWGLLDLQSYEFAMDALHWIHIPVCSNMWSEALIAVAVFWVLISGKWPCNMCQVHLELSIHLSRLLLEIKAQISFLFYRACTFI